MNNIIQVWDYYNKKHKEVGTKKKINCDPCAVCKFITLRLRHTEAIE